MLIVNTFLYNFHPNMWLQFWPQKGAAAHVYSRAVALGAYVWLWTRVRQRRRRGRSPLLPEGRMRVKGHLLDLAVRRVEWQRSIHPRSLVPQQFINQSESWCLCVCVCVHNCPLQGHAIPHNAQQVLFFFSCDKWSSRTVRRKHSSSSVCFIFQTCVTMTVEKKRRRQQ